MGAVKRPAPPSAAESFVRASKSALRYLRSTWPKRSADHEDAIQYAWEHFERKFVGTEDDEVTARWLVTFVRNRMRAGKRDAANRQRLLASEAPGSTPRAASKKERLPTGYKRLPQGRLYRAHSTDTPQHPVIASVRDEPDAFQHVEIRPAIVGAMLDLEFLVGKYMVHRENETHFDEAFREISRSDERRITAAYRAAFGHSPEDAADVQVARSLIFGLEYAHEYAGTPTENRGAAVNVREGGRGFPPWVKDSHLERLFQKTELNPGGRGKATKSIDIAVLDYMNEQRSKRGLARWRSLKAVGLRKAGRANSKRKAAGV